MSDEMTLEDPFFDYIQESYPRGMEAETDEERFYEYMANVFVASGQSEIDDIQAPGTDEPLESTGPSGSIYLEDPPLVKSDFTIRDLRPMEENTLTKVFYPGNYTKALKNHESEYPTSNNGKQQGNREREMLQGIIDVLNGFEENLVEIDGSTSKREMFTIRTTTKDLENAAKSVRSSRSEKLAYKSNTLD